MTADGTTEGELVLIGGRPQLDHREDSLHGEQALLKSHHKDFETLNMDVRVSVIGRIGPPKKAKGCDLPNIWHRGISLGQLRTFARKARTALSKLLPEVPWERMAVWQVCRHFIVPETARRNCSYVELVTDGPQIPNIYVDYQFTMYFADIMSSIEWFAEAMRLRDSEIVFFNLLGVNQNEKALKTEMAKLWIDQDQLILDRAQRECQSLLAATGDSVATRSWV